VSVAASRAAALRASLGRCPSPLKGYAGPLDV
jgi:hypothetical protein